MTSSPLSTRDLYRALKDKLQLAWVAGETGRETPIDGHLPGSKGHALVGGLNWIHPNRIQVIGHSETVYLAELGDEAFANAVDKLFACKPAAVLFSDNIDIAQPFVAAAESTATPLLRSPLSDTQLIFELQYFLTHALAEPLTIHGVFLEVMGMGILLTGESSIGKSELALELITRGHRLIADDAPIFTRIAPDILSGACPTVLSEFLEVRGLGVLNIRAMFGDSAIKQTKYLRLIVNLEKLENSRLAAMDRLDGSYSTCNLLGVEIPQIRVPVAPGRSLAILVEAAVRNHLLRLKGYNASQDFTDRQQQTLSTDSGPTN